MTRPRRLRNTDTDAGAALLGQMAAGDPAAARRLMDDLLPPVYRLAYRMLGEESIAEDMAQEAFIRLWREAPKWRAAAKLSTWLYRVTHNLCIDHLRRQRRLDTLDRDDVPDTAIGAADAHYQRQVSDIVEAALQALPARQRTAIALVHYEGVGNIEAAAIMGVSVDALESLLARGRRALRAQLIDRRPELLGED